MTELELIIKSDINIEIVKIAEKIFQNKRILPEEAILLYNKAELGLLGILADYVRKAKNGNKVYYIQNAHLEPTNICIYKCKFCSYSQCSESNSSWDLSNDEIICKVNQLPDEIKELHITGAVHPDKDFQYYIDLIKLIRSIKPNISIKAFSAVELFYVFEKAGISFEQGLLTLKSVGLNALPGGGAEIFDKEIRSKICNEKVSSENWLNIHEEAHKIGIKSNATILYGHIESYEHRVDHLELLRKLQDKTMGFNAFIPLKFKNRNNLMSEIKEVSIIEDLKNYAVSRIFLDNIPHIKAYWPMIGKQAALLSLSFGTDDIDGTINNSTKIYSLAGAEELSPVISKNELEEMIILSGKEPVERDFDYNPVYC
jgi:aminodeoxyfutalosine synthase